MCEFINGIPQQERIRGQDPAKCEQHRAGVQFTLLQMFQHLQRANTESQPLKSQLSLSFKPAAVTVSRYDAWL